MAKGNPDYELDYVYIKNDDMNFESVHVILNIGMDRMTLTLLSEGDIAPEDVAEILDGLQTGTLRKMHIQYGVNCDVLLFVGDKAFTIKVSKENQTVATLIPAE